MLYQFFHDPIRGSEWYIIDRCDNGTYKAICTRQTKTYRLGCVTNFFFDDMKIWRKGRLKPKNNSLTNLNNKAHQR
jgi:hypothetical protein